MSRRRRVEMPGAIQHVVARGIASLKIVADDGDRRDLIAGLGRTSEHFGWPSMPTA